MAVALDFLNDRDTPIEAFLDHYQACAFPNGLPADWARTSQGFARLAHFSVYIFTAERCRCGGPACRGGWIFPDPHPTVYVVT